MFMLNNNNNDANAFQQIHIYVSFTVSSTCDARQRRWRQQWPHRKCTATRENVFVLCQFVYLFIYLFYAMCGEESKKKKKQKKKSDSLQRRNRIRTKVERTNNEDGEIYAWNLIIWIKYLFLCCYIFSNFIKWWNTCTTTDGTSIGAGTGVFAVLAYIYINGSRNGIWKVCKRRRYTQG